MSNDSQIERQKLIQENNQFIQLPMPSFEQMSNKALRTRADMLRKTFDDLFDDNDDEAYEDDDL